MIELLVPIGALALGWLTGEISKRYVRRRFGVDPVKIFEDRSRRDLIAKRFALDPREREAWAEIAAMQLGEPELKELVATAPAPDPRERIDIPATMPSETGVLARSFEKYESRSRFRSVQQSLLLDLRPPLPPMFGAAPVVTWVASAASRHQARESYREWSQRVHRRSIPPS